MYSRLVHNLLHLMKVWQRRVHSTQHGNFLHQLLFITARVVCNDLRNCVLGLMFTLYYKDRYCEVDLINSENGS